MKSSMLMLIMNGILCCWSCELMVSGVNRVVRFRIRLMLVILELMMLLKVSVFWLFIVVVVLIVSFGVEVLNVMIVSLMMIGDMCIVLVSFVE